LIARLLVRQKIRINILKISAEGVDNKNFFLRSKLYNIFHSKFQSYFERRTELEIKKHVVVGMTAFSN